MNGADGAGGGVRPSRRWRGLGAAVAVLLAVLMAPSATAASVPMAGALPSVSSSVAGAVPVGSDGTIAVDGRGWGHGRGMSQWGAQGASIKGLTYEQILAFYYPSAGLGTSVFGQVRVLLSGLPDEAVVRTATTTVLRDVATGRTLTWGSRGSQLRVVQAPDGLLRVRDWDGTAWINLDAAGWSGAIEGPVVVSAPAPQQIRQSSSTWREYRGSFTVHRGSPVRIVNALDMEQYLYSVVPAESPSYFGAAALRAQAVAARSYAWSDCSGGDSRFDVRDTTACQVYRGRAVITSGTRTSVEQASTTAAVDATRNRVLRRDGVVQRAEFSSSNGGWTVAAAGNPAKADPYDGVDPRNANHTWSTTVTAAQAERSWPSIGRLRDLTVVSRTGGGEWGGRVETLLVRGTSGQVTVTGEQARTGLGLKSSWFAFPAENLPVGSDLLLTAGARGTGQVEVLAYTDASGLVARRSLTRTGMPERSPREWRFFYGSLDGSPEPDLIALHVHNTASGFVEAEVWSHESSYTRKVLDVVTPKQAFDPAGFTHVTTWTKASGGTDLVFFWTDWTDTARASMHVVSAASGYAAYSASTVTGMAGRTQASDAQYLVARSGDVYQVRTQGTTSGRSEVRVYRAVNDWAWSSLTTWMGIGQLDSTRLRFVLDDYDNDRALDLVAVNLARTDGPRIQVYPRADTFRVQRYSRAMQNMPVTSFPTWQAVTVR